MMTPGSTSMHWLSRSTEPEQHAARARHCPTGEARTRAPRHDRHARLESQAHHGDDLVARFRQHHHPRRSLQMRQRVTLVGAERHRVRETVVGSHHGGQLRNEGRLDLRLGRNGCGIHGRLGYSGPPSRASAQRKCARSPSAPRTCGRLRQWTRHRTRNGASGTRGARSGATFDVRIGVPSEK